MRKPIKPKTHGVLDYAAVAFLFFAPAMFNFAGTPAGIFYILGIGYLVMCLMTAYPLGAFKKIPFTVHGAIEIVAAVFLILAPWLFGFAGIEAPRNTYVFFGIAVAVFWVLSDYKAARPGIYRLPEEEDRMAA